MKKIWAILGIMPALCGLQIDPKVIKPLDHYEMDFSHWIIKNENSAKQKISSEQSVDNDSLKQPQKRVRVQKKNLSKLKGQ